jgi:NUMOD3 motif
MNYKKHYDKLMNRSINRNLGIYTESHHIIPKCIGGYDDKTNLVELTPEEHFVAHQLLVKIYPQVDKLLFAAKMMCVGSSKHKRSNKLYGWLRRRFIESISKPCSEQTKEKIGKANKGKGGRNAIYTEERRQLVSKQWLGTIRSEETRNKISESRKGIVFSKEHKQKLKDSAKNRVYKKAVCPFCGKEGTVHNVKKYHFENCKFKEFDQQN